MAKKVVMFGATGMAGIPIARRLGIDGHDITVVTRNPQEAKTRIANAVRAVRGDISDSQSLRLVLTDADAVVIVMPLSIEEEGAFNAERDGTRNILAALPADKRARIVKLSEIGAGSDPTFRDLEAKADAERAIKVSGNPYVIFRPTWFMEAWIAQLRAGADFLAIGGGKRAIHWVALEDLARWMSRAIESPQVENLTLTVQGMDALTVPQAAAKLAHATNANVISVPIDGLRPPGMPDSMVRTLHELFHYYEHAPELFEADELWRHLGRPEVSFDDFVMRLASALPAS
jgi:uncharacterized protein YbjT (DUF2867 family)